MFVFPRRGSPAAFPAAAPLSASAVPSAQAVYHSELAAAVTNGGGLGVIGGLTMSPDQLTSQIMDIKANLVDKSGNFGVDLAIPQVVRCSPTPTQFRDV